MLARFPLRTNYFYIVSLNFYRKLGSRLVGTIILARIMMHKSDVSMLRQRTQNKDTVLSFKVEHITNSVRDIAYEIGTLLAETLH